MIVETLACIEGDKPYFTAGIVLFDDIVVEAAPIVGYMKQKKWTRAQVRKYCETKGWKISVVHQFSRRESVA